MVSQHPRILVTGSRGFIGTHLIARLRSDHYDFIEWSGDVRTIGQCDERADVVLHLAAATRHDQFQTGLQQSYDVNVVGTLAVLNYCKKAGATCVYVSTSGVYQAPKEPVPLCEDAAVEPNSPYSISKYLAEKICDQQANDLSIPSVVLRLFNVYGEGQHPSFLVPYITNSLIEKKTIQLRMPNALRDFIYVGDVAESLIKASKLRDPGFKTFNIGSGHATRVIDFVHHAEKAFGAAVGIVTDQPHPGELPAIIANISRAKDQLGWEPKYDLMSGLAAMRAAVGPLKPTF